MDGHCRVRPPFRPPCRSDRTRRTAARHLPNRCGRRWDLRRMWIVLRRPPSHQPAPVRPLEKDSRRASAERVRRLVQTASPDGQRAVARRAHTRRPHRHRASAASPIHRIDRHRRHARRDCLSRSRESDGHREAPEESGDLLVAATLIAQSHRLTTRGGDPENRTRAVRNKEDRAVAVPRATVTKRNVRQCLHRSAIDVDPLELDIGKEPNGFAIGRPERQSCTVGSGQRPCGNRIQRTQP